MKLKKNLLSGCLQEWFSKVSTVIGKYWFLILLVHVLYEKIPKQILFFFVFPIFAVKLVCLL